MPSENQPNPEGFGSVSTDHPRFAMVYTWVFDVVKDPRALQVYTILASFARDGECYPLIGMIAGMAGCDSKTVSRAFRQLEEAGMLETVAQYDKAGRRDRNLYRLRQAPRGYIAPPAPVEADPPQKGGVPPTDGGRVPPTDGGTNNKQVVTDYQTEEPPKPPEAGKLDPIKEVVCHLNLVTSRAYRSDSEAWKPLRARLRDARNGQAEAVIRTAKAIVDCKWAEWGKNPDMKKFVRPETLFRASHWDSYAMDAEEWIKSGRPGLSKGKGKEPPTAASIGRLLDGVRALVGEE